MKIKTKNKELLSQIESLKAEHPFWGYRRIWAYLKYRYRYHGQQKAHLPANEGE
jgi:hypothetical protein